MSFSSLSLPGLNVNIGADMEYLTVLQSPSLTSDNVPLSWRHELCKISSLPRNHLANDIHPLFRRSRWPDLGGEDHDLLLPALRIATKFLTEPLLLRWWTHTLFGRLYLDRHDRSYLAYTPFEDSQHASTLVRMLLEKILPKMLEFTFHNLDSKGARVDGCTFSSNRAYLRFRHYVDTYFCRPTFDIPRIVLHSQYWFSLKYLLLHGSARELENLHLRIAITLCHELAHVVWKYRVEGFGVPAAQAANDAEPLHSASEHVFELGHSWEHFVFGGTIWTMDRPGSFTAFYQARGCDANVTTTTTTKTCVLVPQWWISMWSWTQTWTRFPTLFRLGQLHLPTEYESGYALRELRVGPMSTWALYRRGVPVLFRCRNPSGSVSYHWNMVRPLVQKMLAESEAGGRRASASSAMRRLRKEFYDILTSPDFVDEASPEVFRKRVEKHARCCLHL